MFKRKSKSQKTNPADAPGASSSAGPSAQPAPPAQLAREYQVQLANANQRAKFAELSRRDMRPTLFYDQIVCGIMGIDEDVRRLASTFGLGHFLDVRVPTSAVTADPEPDLLPAPPRSYRQLTLEFLSSFSFHLTSGEDEDVTFEIRFRLFNHAHTLTDAELNTLFGWSTVAKDTNLFGTDTVEYEEPNWWVRISQSGGQFESKASKASDIMHPALRYLHRMLVYMFFSRRDVGKTSSIEIYLLWRAVEDAEVNLTAGERLNLGYLLAKRFKEIRDKQGMTGPILIGGMVTWIAYKLGYAQQLRQLVPISDETLLDEAHLHTMKMIRAPKDRRINQFVWLVKETPWCYLPSPFVSNPPAGVANRWQVPMGHIEDRDMSRKEREARLAMIEGRQQAPPSPPQQQQQQSPPPSPPPIRASPPLQQYQRRSRPSTQEGGTSSSFNFEEAFARLSMQVEQLQHPPPSVYESNMYSYHVDQGHFAPYVNYPYHPPQQGPVPSWEYPGADNAGSEAAGSSTLCYPYWQGPGTQHNPPHHFPPYDYRLPGGCDYRGDPNYPGPPGFPPGFTGGWEPHGPPTDLDYEWRPQDPPQ